MGNGSQLHTRKFTDIYSSCIPVWYKNQKKSSQFNFIYKKWKNWKRCNLFFSVSDLKIFQQYPLLSISFYIIHELKVIKGSKLKWVWFFIEYFGKELYKVLKMIFYDTRGLHQHVWNINILEIFIQSQKFKFP